MHAQISIVSLSIYNTNGSWFLQVIQCERKETDHGCGLSRSQGFSHFSYNYKWKTIYSALLKKKEVICHMPMELGL